MGRNRIGVLRWSMLVTILEFEAPRQLVFATKWREADQTRWSFVIESTELGTRVTEKFDVVGRISLRGRIMFPERRPKRQLVEGCRITLDRLRIAAETTHAASVTRPN
jgi:uncharacterized protein YndB with AHSA1/START domain